MGAPQLEQLVQTTIVRPKKKNLNSLFLKKIDSKGWVASLVNTILIQLYRYSYNEI